MLKTTGRAMARQKINTSILLVGMTIGLTACFWMFFWIVQELRFESNYANADRVYRVEMELKDGDITSMGAATPTPLAPTLQSTFPEIELASRIHPFAQSSIRVGEQSFNEDRIMAVDPSFLEIFNLNILSGDLYTALNNTNSIVLTESIVMKYFGKEANIIGKLIRIDEENSMQITAVIHDLPANTHFDFEILIPLEFAHKAGREIAPNYWHRFDEIYTYVLAAKGTDRLALESKLALVQQQHVQGSEDVLYLRPLQAIRFASDVVYDFASHTNTNTLYFLLLISILIFAMA